MYETKKEEMNIWLHLHMLQLLWSIYSELVAGCPIGCLCSFRMVDCHSKKLTAFPSGFPKSTRILKLSNNNIRNISISDVRGLNELKLLYLTGNDLYTLDREVFCKIPTIRDLHLNINRISRLPPDVFSCLKHLTNLDLRHNFLVSFELFGGSESLVSLQLGGNMLNTISGATLSKNIRVVDLSENRISKFGVFSRTFKIGHISLRKNKLTAIPPDSFRGLHCEGLDLGNNVISEIHFGTIQEIKGLRHLYLTNNKIILINKEMLLGLKELKALNLENNEISWIEEGAFTSLGGVRVLNLQRNKLTSLNQSAFVGLSSLLDLLLNKNELREIDSGVFNPLINLQVLDLSENNLVDINVEFFNSLQNLLTLRLSSNQAQCSCEYIHSLESLKTKRRISAQCHGRITERSAFFGYDWSAWNKWSQSGDAYVRFRLCNTHTTRNISDAYVSRVHQNTTECVLMSFKRYLPFKSIRFHHDMTFLEQRLQSLVLSAPQTPRAPSCVSIGCCKDSTRKNENVADNGYHKKRLHRIVAAVSASISIASIVVLVSVLMYFRQNKIEEKK